MYAKSIYCSWVVAQRPADTLDPLILHQPPQSQSQSHYPFIVIYHTANITANIIQ